MCTAISFVDSCVIGIGELWCITGAVLRANITADILRTVALYGGGSE